MLSYCMIVKNEAETLRDNLVNAQRFVDEIVIVDTGSDDGTREIAKEFADKYKEIEWPDSFSEARNISLEMATENYIMYLDGDEVMEVEEYWRNIRTCLKVEEPDAVAIQIENSLPDEQMLKGDRVWEVRVFRNHPDIRFRGRVHNQITPSIKENLIGDEAKVLQVEAVANHEGYDNTPEGQREKYEERIPLIEKEVEEADGGKWEAYYRYQLVNGLFMIEEFEVAYEELKKLCFDNLTKENEYSARLIGSHLCLNVGDLDRADSLASGMLEMWGQEPMSFLMKGMTQLRLGRNNSALSFLIAAIHLGRVRDNVRYDIDPHYIASSAGEAAYKLEDWRKAKNYFQFYLEKYEDEKIRGLEESIVPKSELQEDSNQTPEKTY